MTTNEARYDVTMTSFRKLTKKMATTNEALATMRSAAEKLVSCKRLGQQLPFASELSIVAHMRLLGEKEYEACRQEEEAEQQLLRHRSEVSGPTIKRLQELHDKATRLQFELQTLKTLNSSRDVPAVVDDSAIAGLEEIIQQQSNLLRQLDDLEARRKEAAGVLEEKKKVQSLAMAPAANAARKACARLLSVAKQGSWLDKATEFEDIGDLSNSQGVPQPLMLLFSVFNTDPCGAVRAAITDVSPMSTTDENPLLSLGPKTVTVTSRGEDNKVLAVFYWLPKLQIVTVDCPLISGSENDLGDTLPTLESLFWFTRSNGTTMMPQASQPNFSAFAGGKPYRWAQWLAGFTSVPPPNRIPTSKIVQRLIDASC